MNPYLTAFKYNIKVREQKNTGKTWILYENFLNDGIENPVFCDHIEFNCNLHTSERFYTGLGICMVANGKVTYQYSPVDGSKYIVLEEIGDE